MRCCLFLVLFIHLVGHSQIIETVSEEERKKVFEKVEIQAAYEGDFKTWEVFVREHLDPCRLKLVTEDSLILSDSVAIRFVVTKDKMIGDIQVLFSTGTALANEFLRIIRLSSGQWMPGMSGTRQLNSWHTESIRLRKLVNNFPEIAATIYYNLNGGKVYAVRTGYPCVDIPADDQENIFTHSPMGAYYKGGQYRWKQFLEKEFSGVAIAASLPDSSLPAKDSVIAKFVVRKTGEITDLEILYAGNTAMFNETARLIRLSSGYWQPANAGGSSVHSWRYEKFYFIIESIKNRKRASIDIK